MSIPRPLSPESEGKVELPSADQEPPGPVNPDANLESNVIDTAQERASSPSTEKSSPMIDSAKPSSMTLSIQPLSDLELHSPSHIVGTPFAVSAQPYEYPFPESGSTSTFNPFPPPSSLGHRPSISSISADIAFASLSSAPYFRSVTPPILPSFPISYPTTTTYSSAHPKLRQAIPPVPPGLYKKRQRFSLELGKNYAMGRDVAREGSRSPSLDTISQNIAGRRLQERDRSSSETNLPRGE